jgi:arginine:agmatine antiporter
MLHAPIIAYLLNGINEMIKPNDEKNKIGAVALTAMVTGNMMGAGVFMLPANLAQIGSVSIWGWIITALGAAALAWVFAMLSMTNPKAGGPYAYAKEGYGDYLGFQTVYAYWLAAWVGNIAIAIVSVGYLAHFMPFLRQPWLACLTAIAIIWFFTFANGYGAKWVGQLQIVTTAVMLVPVVGVAVFGWFWFSPEIFTSAYNVSGNSDLSAVSSAASLTLWAFIGVESAAVSASVVKNPHRNIPLATVSGVILAAITYILSSSVIMGIIPHSELVVSTAPFALAVEKMIGPSGGWIVGGCAVLACFGTLAGWTLLVGQSAKAAADDCLFPAIFSKVNKRDVPFPGLILVAAMMSIILLLTISPTLSRQFETISLITVFLVLLPYLYTAAAAIILGYRARMPKVRYLCLALIALVALIYSFWAVIGVGPAIVYYGSLALLASAPLYLIVLWRRRHSRE